MKNKCTLLVWLLCVFSLMAYSQDKQLEFEKVTIKLDELKSKYSTGDSISVSFVFQNISTKPVKLLGVDSSCTCTVPTFTQEEVAPLAKGKVILTTTYDQLYIARSVYAVVMSNSSERYHKLTLEW